MPAMTLSDLKSLTGKDIKRALELFDRNHRDAEAWDHWEYSGNYLYAIKWAGRRYPVKTIIRLAAGDMEARVYGGEGRGKANEFVRERGFEVIRFR